MNDSSSGLSQGDNWDFEMGDLSFWNVEGDAFSNQPVRGDGISTIRVAPVTLGGDYWDGPYPIGQHGDYWVGSAENPLGDSATGTLTSQEFLITTRLIHFLVSGTYDPRHIRVELQVRAEDYQRLFAAAGADPETYRGVAPLNRDGDFLVLYSVTGHDSEILRQETWDLEALLSLSRKAQLPLRARIKIIDASRDGHINVDHFQFMDRLPERENVPLWGFADLHCHLMAHMAFGGNLFWGKPTDPIKKLQRCDGKGHGGRLFSGYVLHEIEAGDDPRYRANRHAVGPWPTWTSRTHQEVHIDWVRRAYEGGLRLMGACAVNNQLLEHLMNSSLLSATPKDDLSAIAEQVKAMKHLAEQHADWMAIAYSSTQARQIIKQGKLALVLTAEVDQLGGWKREQDCTNAQVAQLLDTLYEQGLRMLIPIHLADNAFGGAAIYDNMFNTLNCYLNDEYFSVCDGYEVGVQFRLWERPDRKVMKTRLLRIVQEEKAIERYLQIPAEHGHINEKGLTERGKFLLHHMMRKGMVIDVDHMSHRAVEDALQIAEQHDYPLVASHSTFRELARSAATEAMKTRQQVERIASLGGVVAPMPAQGDVRAVNDVLPVNCRVPNDCAGSVKSWAQAYLYAVSLMRGRGVALGTDFNGLVIKPRPRFHDPLSPALPQAPQNKSVRYTHYARSLPKDPSPFDRENHPGAFVRPHPPLIAANDGAYDINLMGLAHYGMIPDFLQDGRNVGLSEQDLKPLFRSASDYLAMWEKCERRSQDFLAP
ncbi:MAG TPA: membrane dipeptidase [Ktedonosporobacter sp.]|jgi:microsomal dipeptidase-like Zn-dependent dipeptidase|nr:membrane dipeptidase [Ktedonosporobacter sp.]